MAEALVEIVLEQLVSIRRQQAAEGISLIAGAEQEVEKLQSNLLCIQALLVDAEDRQVKENAVRAWLDDLKDVSYDIDDVLDEWNTKLQKLKIKKAEDASNPLKKVRSFILHYLGCRPLVMRYGIGFKIKALDRKLDLIAVERDRFNFKTITEGSKEVGRPMTASIMDLTEDRGRDKDKNSLVNLLLSQSSQQQILPIISIVGMGGIGKTTLARLAFNDDKVHTHFDKKIWVCVSEPFDELRIAKAILESFDKESKLVELEKIRQEIRGHIGGKKFLLVLDDVWTENPENWENLKHTLKCGSQESRILVTTRKENVANVIRTTNTISLGLLSEDESWSLFSQLAFWGKTNREFEEIGKKIVHKCKGLPFALKALGSLLHFKRKFEEWENVLNSEIWELKEVEQRIFPPLLLSYNDLPSMLKKCFLYCVIFPNDYRITKDKLIKLWMAQGYFKGHGRDDEFLIGEKCFKNLEMRHFFQEFERSEYDGSIISCKMHNIVHALARFLVKNEFCTIEIDGLAKPELEFYYKEARHLMIIGNSTSIDVHNEKLRSLIVERTASDFKIEVDLSKLFDKLTCIRTLGLSSCSLEEIHEGIKKLISLRYLNLSHNVKLGKLPKTLCELYQLETLDVGNCSLEEIEEGIKKLINLRYLNLSCNVKLEKLPETLCELYNLETLDVTNCFRLQKLPHGLGKLSKLRHLRNHGTSLSNMPTGIQRLTSLRELSKFVVSNVNDDNKACRLARLEDLNDLRGFLLITGLGNVSEVGEVKKAKLEDKKNLYGLGLRFDGWMYAEDEGIFEGLQPPPNLQELMIQYYTGKTMPLTRIRLLTKLRVLKLSSCFEFKCLPALGELSTLESLMIWNMTSVKKVGNKFLGIEIGNKSSSSSSPSTSVFPNLKYLAMWSMEEWEEWEESDFDVTSIMPCLHSLKLSSCPKLKSLPKYIIRPAPRLQKLEIKNCDMLEQHYNKNTGKDFSKVSHIPGFLIMEDSMSSTSLVNVDPEINSAKMESRIQDKGKGKMPIDFSTTMGSDPRTSNSV